MTVDDGRKRQLRITSFRHFAYLPLFVALGIKAFQVEQLEISVVEHNGSWSGLIEAVGGRASDVMLGNLWFALQQTRHANALAPVAHCMQQCRSVVVRRRVETDGPFDWMDLQGSSIIVQSDVPTPWVAFRQSLALHAVSLDMVRVLVGHTAREAVEDVLSGAVDYVLLDVERAQHQDLEEVAALADTLGPVPWSVFMARTSDIQSDPERYWRFQRAIGRALDWMSGNQTGDIAALVRPWFPYADVPTTIKIIERYRALHAWPIQPQVQIDDARRWQDILVRWGLMLAAVPLDGLLTFGGRFGEPHGGGI